MQGEISKSMGVDTKPAHKFEINGYWLMLDPNADKATVEEVESLVKINSLIDAKKGCLNCKHEDLDLDSSTCWDCAIVVFQKGIAHLKSNWEAKQ